MCSFSSLLDVLRGGESQMQVNLGETTFVPRVPGVDENMHQNEISLENTTA